MSSQNYSMVNDTNLPNPDNPEDPLVRLFNQYRRNTKLIISISVVGIVLFLIAALALPFRNKIFEAFYPKPKSQASACSGNVQFPANRGGFVFTGGDLEQAISSLKTSLYHTNDLSLGPKKTVFTIGKYTQNQADPLGLRLLMGNNLSNIDFKGLGGKMPVGWDLITDSDGAASVDVMPENVLSGGSSVKVANSKSSSDTQISQVFKKTVSENQLVVFGTWVKTAGKANVKISLQNSKSPNQEFGNVDVKDMESNNWTYLVGYGKVPVGVTNFQLVLKVSGSNQAAWFNSAAATVISSDQNQAISDLVLARCGSAWMVDDGPGWDQTSTPVQKPLSADIYALLYHQFYTLIKNTDPSAKVLPGGLMGAPIIFEGKSDYSPKVFLDNFRASYKSFFNSEPPIDALGIRYLAADKNRWMGSEDLENYLSKLRDYMNKVNDWKETPIWLTRLGVSKNAPNEGLDFMQAAIKFLVSNNLKIEKWFWYDTCGFNSQLSPLFVATDKVCSWPMKLTPLGEAYVALNTIPTPSPTPTSTPKASTTPTPTPVQTPIPNSPAQISTSSATPGEGTPGGKVAQ